MKKQTLIGLVLLVFILAGISLAIFIISSSTSVPLEQQTQEQKKEEMQMENKSEIPNAVDFGSTELYKNYAYGFSFQYPKGFQSNIFNEPELDINSARSVTFGKQRMPNETLYKEDLEKLGYFIRFSANRSGDVNREVKNLEQYADRSGYQKKESKILGVKAYRFDNVGDGPVSNQIIFEKNGVVFTLELAMYSESKEVLTEGEKVFQTMQSSFRFD